MKSQKNAIIASQRVHACWITGYSTLDSVCGGRWWQGCVCGCVMTHPCFLKSIIKEYCKEGTLCKHVTASVKNKQLKKYVYSSIASFCFKLLLILSPFCLLFTPVSQYNKQMQNPSSSWLDQVLAVDCLLVCGCPYLLGSLFELLYPQDC